MKSFQKVVALVLAVALTAGSALSAFAAPVTTTAKAPVYTVQMVGQTLTLFKDGKAFIPYELSKTAGKNGVKITQTKTGEIKLMFTDANDTLRSINIGKETNLEIKGTFPSLNIDSSVKDVSVTVAAYDKTDKTAIPTIIKDLKVAGAVDLKVSAGAAIDKASITNKDAKVDVAKGSEMKNVSVADGVKIEGDGKKDVTTSTPGGSTGGSSDGGGGGDWDGGGTTPPPVTPTEKVAAPTIVGISDNGLSLEFTVPSAAMEEIEKISIYVKSSTSNEWKRTMSTVGYEGDRPTDCSFVWIFNDMLAGDYQVKVVSVSKYPTQKANNETVFDKTFALTKAAAPANVTYQIANNADAYGRVEVVATSTASIKEGNDYHVYIVDADGNHSSFGAHTTSNGLATFKVDAAYIVKGNKMSILGGTPATVAGNVVSVSVSEMSEEYIIDKTVDETPAVDKEALQYAISVANQASINVTVAEKAADVAVGTKWVTESVMATFKAVLEDATDVKLRTDATQDEVDAAEAALVPATATFTAATQDGTMTEPTEPTDKVITDVVAIETVTVDYCTTTTSAIAALPETVTVNLDDGSTAEILVTSWEIADYDGDVAGIYVATATLGALPENVTDPDGLLDNVTANVVVAAEGTTTTKSAITVNVVTTPGAITTEGAITVTTSVDGTVTDEAAKDDVVTVTIGDPANTDWKFDGIRVEVLDEDGDVVKTIALSEITLGEEYTFTMPATAVTITITLSGITD